MNVALWVLMKKLVRRINKQVRRAGWFFRGELDARRLRTLWPEMNDYHAKMPLDPHPLKPAYEQYVGSVSKADMAVSWETSCFLYFVATTRGCRTVLDLGSGFSSYVLRASAIHASNGATVNSVDDDALWLDKTESFLADNAMPIDRLTTWTQFNQHNHSRFDLIFHDLGNMRTRAETFPAVLDLLEDGGLLVLDDMHNKRYRRVVEKHSGRNGISLYSVRKHTLDEYDRFAEIVVNNGAVGIT